MTLSVNKREVMHTGRNNLKCFYFAYIAKGSELTVFLFQNEDQEGVWQKLTFKMITSNITAWDLQLKMTGNRLKNQKGPLFNQCVFKQWNSSPDCILDAESLHRFKNKVTKGKSLKDY